MVVRQKFNFFKNERVVGVGGGGLGGGEDEEENPPLYSDL